MREPREVNSVRIVFVNHRSSEALNIKVSCDEYGKVTLTQYFEWGAEIPVAILEDGKWHIEGSEATRVFGRLLKFAGAELKRIINEQKQ